MKKIITALCVALVIFAIGWNAYQADKKANTGKKKVYAILPITGGLSFQGKDEKKVMEIWMQNHPDAAFELEILDNESNPTKSLTLAQRVAMSDKQPLFIVPIGAMGHPIVPQLKQMNGFMILSPSTQEEDGTYKEFQRISFGGDDMNKPFYDYIKPGQSVVIIHSNDMAGHSDADKAQKAFTKKGANVIDKLEFDTSALDMRILVLKALAHKPDAIFITTPPTIGFINVMRELKRQEYAGTVFAISITSPSVMAQVKDYVEGVYVAVMPTERTHQKHPQIVKALSDNGMDLYWVTINVWDIMDVVNHFVANNIPFKQEEFMKLGKWHGISCDVQFMKNGNSAYEFVLAVVKNGKFEVVEEKEH